MKIAQLKLRSLLAVAALCICVSAIAAEHDYYRNLRYPKQLVAGVGRDQVQQAGGPNGPKDHWPLQREFEKFYGTIIAARTDSVSLRWQSRSVT
jgi:hypothetical protein